MECSAGAYQDVAAHGDGSACVFGYFGGGGGQAAEVAAEAGVGLDDDAATQGDVWGAFNAGAAGDFVACFLREGEGTC